MSSAPVQGLSVQLLTANYLSKNVALPAFVQSLKPRSLLDISDTRTQEVLVVRDLLYVLIGYEGNYVRYSERYDATRVQDRICGPEYKTAKHLNVALKSITKKLATYGKWYSGLDNFVQIYDHPNLGRVNQRLCFEIRGFLKEYQKLILEFENHVKQAPLSVTEMDNIILQRCANTMAHLYEIANTIHMRTEERTESPSFNSFLEFVKQDLEMNGSMSSSTDTNKFSVCKGGVVLQLVTERINSYKGDSVAFQFLTQLFDAISTDYVSLLNEWLIEGHIQDPFGEFLIKKNELPANIFYSNMEKYWSELYVVKLDGVPDQLSSKDIQQKILATGKYLNIFRQCSGIISFKALPEFAQVSSNPIDSLFSPDLHLKIIHSYKMANKLLLRLLLEGYQFQTLIENLHETYLLNKSFQIDKFITAAFHDLSRDKQAVPTARVQRLYDQVVRKPSDEPSSGEPSISDILPHCAGFSVDTNNFYELAEEIIAIESFDADKEMKDTDSVLNAIKRIVSQSLSRRQASLSESERTRSLHDVDAIDQYTVASVNVDLSLPFPINLIVGDNFVFEYQLLFKLQMLLKYANMATDRTWKEINFSTVWRYRGFHPSVKTSVVKCRALNASVKGFMNLLQSYFNYQIVEDNFLTLLSILQKFSVSASQQVAPQQSSSNEKNFIKSFFNGNDVFDAKINAMSNKQGSSTHSEESFDDVQDLKNHVGTYLNNMLRDAMVTDGKLLLSLHNVLNVVIHINNYMSRLKKSLVLMDERQFAAFRRDMPERFADLEVNPELIGLRAASFKQIVDAYTETFNQAVSDMLFLLRSTSVSENHHLLGFATQLEASVGR